MPSGYSILIADDNSNDVSLLLDGFADIQVAVAPTHVQDGESALQLLLRDQTFHLAVLDFYLPKKTGAEIVEALRARGQNTVPIVILTSHLSDEQRRVLLNAGVRAILQKPVELSGFALLASNLVSLVRG